MKIKSIRDIKNITCKKVLLRTDFNVPIKNKKIIFDYKIKASLPTIKFLLKHKCKIIIISRFS